MTLAQLLVVQAHDSAIDRLNHQRTTLAELGALGECDEERGHLEAARAEVAQRRHDLSRDQKRLEDDIALIEDRRNGENERLYSGTVTAHKDLQAIQAELEVLAERQARVEDDVLELMERAEPIDAELDGFDERLAQIAERRQTIEASLADSQAAIDTEIEAEQTARASAIEGVASDLVAEYERVRQACGGVGIAELNGKTCEGCRLQLSAVDYDRIRKEPSDAVVHCTECQRLLVR